MTQEQLETEVTALLAKWRPIFGLSEFPLTVIYEAVPFGLHGAVSAVQLRRGSAQARISISTRWLADDIWITLESAVIHELIHILYARSAGDARRDAIMALVRAGSLPPKARREIQNMIEDIEEGHTEQMEAVISSAYQCGYETAKKEAA